MKRYELIEGKAAKFWQWDIRGSQLVIEYGRIGTAGQSTVKDFASEAEASAAAAKLVKEKVGKGYQPAGESGAAEAASSVRVAAAETAEAPATPAAAPPVASAPAPRSDRSPLRFIDEAGLSELAATLAKKSKKQPQDLVEARVGDDRWNGEHRVADGGATPRIGAAHPGSSRRIRRRTAPLIALITSLTPTGDTNTAP